jgi:hypothetical protein
MQSTPPVRQTFIRVVTMGLPQAPEARRFYRAAKQRFAEAEVLLRAEMEIGAVYLAGYTVECFLKALLLEGTPASLRKRLLAKFRGSRAHDITWLRDLYRRNIRGNIPRGMALHLTRVATWDTDLRYETVLREQGDANEFFQSVVALTQWADGRI